MAVQVRQLLTAYKPYNNISISMTKKQFRYLALWAALCFGCACTVLALGYFRTYPFPRDFLAQVFISMALPGHFIFFCFLLCLPSLILSQLLPKPRLILSVLGVFLGGFMLVLVVDLKVFELYRFHLNSMVWQLLTGGAAGDIFEFSSIDALLVGLLLVGVILVSSLCLYGAKLLALSNKKIGRWFFLLCILLMFSGQALYAWADASVYQPILKQLRMIPWSQPLTAKSFFEKRGWVNLEENKVEISMPGMGAMNYPKQGFDCEVGDSQGLKNVLVIMIDTMRFDLLVPEVMPFTSNLANTGSRYTDHYSTSNATRFGIFGFFYGLYGSYWHMALGENRPPVLLDIMQQRDYEFGIFASAKLTSPEFDRTVFAAVRENIELSTPGANKATRDINANDRFKAFMEKRDTAKPFFGLLFYDAAHGYAYPSDFPLKFTPVLDKVSYVQLNRGSDPEPLLNRYKNSLNFIDGLVEQAVKAVIDAGEMDDTIIVITSDHGQEFNDTGGNYWGHNGNYSQWQTKVPMAIVYPDREPKIFSHMTSHIDVVPTLFRDAIACSPLLETYTQGNYMDDEAGRDFLLFNSWSKFGYYDKKNHVTIHNGGIVDVYDQDYQSLDDVKPKKELLLKAMQLNSEFLN